MIFHIQLHNLHLKFLNDIHFSRRYLWELAWCENYPDNGSYAVKVINSFSEPISVSEGTAQWSVLGPLHFLLYVNDLSNNVKYCTCYKFSDDPCLIGASNDPNIAIQMIQKDQHPIILFPVKPN